MELLFPGCLQSIVILRAISYERAGKFMQSIMTLGARQDGP